VRLKRAISEQELRHLYEGASGIELVDDRKANSFPTPLKASGQDAVLVGRLRLDPGVPKDEEGRSQGVCLLACGDQLRKGAATNALQIADLLGLLAPTERPTASTHKEPCTIVR
jgi:aspartate-semialdehyde dehydrogenase